MSSVPVPLLTSRASICFSEHRKNDLTFSAGAQRDRKGAMPVKSTAGYDINCKSTDGPRVSEI